MAQPSTGRQEPANSRTWGAVIVEATYGVSRHQPRQEREEQFCQRVRDVLLRDGRVLLPCVALGRAQALHFALAMLTTNAGLP